MLEIDIDLVPKSEEAVSFFTKKPDLEEDILTGGDDYELLFTIPSHYRKHISKQKNIRIIGKAKQGKSVQLIKNNKILDLPKNLGFIHK